MFGSTLMLVVLVVFWYMLALFLTSLMRRDSSIADVAWGPGLLIAVLATLWWWRPAGYLPLIATVFVAVWSFRLALHVLLRNWGVGEGSKYAELRVGWGEWFAFHSFFRIFLPQGLLLIAVALPVLWINTFGGPVGWIALIGAAVWLKGFLWESIADYQLVRFLKKPEHRGRILQSGLWRYSRHPNYFGEIVQWWGFWLMAFSVQGGWVTIIGPLTITFLLIKVSGIPILEKRQMQNPAFREYAKRTSALLPWFPKK